MKGFTLAEVLITLGIIGIVAALTIPMLMSKYNRYITETRLRGIYSTILQGFKMAQYNEVALSDSVTDDADVNGYSYARSKAVFETMFLPVFSGGTEYPRNTEFYRYSADGSTSFDRNTFMVYYVLNNGTVIGFCRAGNYDGMIFEVILNPRKSKLISGKDIFTFVFQNDGRDNYVYKQLFKNIYDSDRETLIKFCKTNVRTPAYASAPYAYCTHLIYLNNFHIPDDYPIRF